IHAWAGDNPDGLRTGTVTGITYWQTDKLAAAPGTHYFYMDVDDTYLHDTNDQNVQVTVEYFDEGSGKMVLQYDAESAAFKDAPLFTYTDTKTWKTHTFDLTDARFANRTNGADFRLGIEGGGASASTNADLKVASVNVTKTPKNPPEPDNSVGITLGEVPVTNGITANAGDYPEGLQTGELAGKGYWKTNKAAPSPGTLFFYMNVSDEYLFDNQDQNVFVTIEYLDKGNGSIVLQYDALSAAFKDAPLFTYTDTNQWKSYTVKLSDAKFANRANGADFRIGVEG
ncbi:S-layer protein, partial [Paenibacillus sepulcri]|nr:S-layer protein [Paenibacillus sepulcri]